MQITRSALSCPKDRTQSHFTSPEISTPPPLGENVAEPLTSSSRPARRTHALGFLAAALIVLACAAYGVYRWTRPPAGLRSIVVLPFENLTGDPQKEYLADGITEQLTDSLAHISDLRVVARTSAFQFKRKPVDIRRIGQQVDADAVVEGSLRNMNGRFQLTVQVNRSRDGYHIVSQTFDGSAQELERLEADLVPPVLAAVRPRTTVAKHKPVDPEAYDLFLKARARRADPSRASFDQSITYLNEAIQRDPTYADAYAALAGVYAAAAGNLATQPLAYAEKAKAAATAALRLDPLSAQAYAAEGLVDSMVFLDWKRGEEELREAIRLMPQNAASHNRLGTVLLAQGHFEAAIAEQRTAANLDPLVPGGVSVGLAYYMARQYDQALRQFIKVRDLHPDLLIVHPFIGSVWEAKGDYKKAMAEYQLALPKAPESVKPYIAHLLAVMGKQSEARKILAEMQNAGPGERPPSAFDLAAIYGALGDRDKAFQYLEQAYDDRIVWFLKVHPVLDPLRSDPRFAQLLKKAGLA